MKRATIVAVLASLVLASGAIAAPYGNVQVKLSSVSPSLSMQTMIKPYDASWYTGPTGQFNLQYLTVPPVLLNPEASCVEPQTVSVGGTYTYTVVDPAEVPVPKGPGDQGQGPMGTTKADYLREFWALAFPGVVDNVTGAAFQLGVWEIVFEDLPASVPTGWDVKVGQFSANQTGGNADLAIAQANAWLGLVDGTGPMATLYGLTHPTAQDFIVSPEPTTLALLGLGAAGFLVRRRR